MPIPYHSLGSYTCKSEDKRGGGMGAAYSWIREVIERFLIRGICRLKIIQHQIAVACVVSRARAHFVKASLERTNARQHFSVRRLHLQDGPVAVESLGKLIARSVDACHSVKSWHGPLVATQRMVEAFQRRVMVIHLLCQRS